MSIEGELRRIASYRRSIDRLQQDKAKIIAHRADQERRAIVSKAAASRASSLSTAKSKLSEAARFESRALTDQKRIVDIEKKIAKESAQLHDAESKLQRMQAQEHRQGMADDTRRISSERVRMTAMQKRLDDHEVLHSLAISAIEGMRDLPEKVKILFLASNPLDQDHLRLDEEVRSIEEMIRKSEYRESVELRSRWAARPLDVLQAMNEYKPQIVHISGHGFEDDGIAFMDESGRTKVVSTSAIVAAMATGSQNLKLVFFNTCHSKRQAHAVVMHVPAAIGMKDSIGDQAARIFSSQFYSAIGFGLSLEESFAQARASLLLESIPEEDVPELFLTPGLRADELVLVRKR